VTVITTEAEKRPTPNMKTIVMDTVSHESRGKRDLEYFIAMPLLGVIYISYEWGCHVCEEEFRSAGAQQLLNYSSTERQ
jgi:hypothetical protein